METPILIKQIKKVTDTFIEGGKKVTELYLDLHDVPLKYLQYYKVKFKFRHNRAILPVMRIEEELKCENID